MMSALCCWLQFEAKHSIISNFEYVLSWKSANKSTLPETNSSHLKHWNWKMSFLLGFGLLVGAMPCSLMFADGNIFWKGMLLPALLRGCIWTYAMHVPLLFVYDLQGQFVCSWTTQTKCEPFTCGLKTPDILQPVVPEKFTSAAPHTEYMVRVSMNWLCKLPAKTKGTCISQVHILSPREKNEK